MEILGELQRSSSWALEGIVWRGRELGACRICEYHFAMERMNGRVLIQTWLQMWSEFVGVNSFMFLNGGGGV